MILHGGNREVSQTQSDGNVARKLSLALRILIFSVIGLSAPIRETLEVS